MKTAFVNRFRAVCRSTLPALAAAAALTAGSLSVCAAEMDADTGVSPAETVQEDSGADLPGEGGGQTAEPAPGEQEAGNGAGEQAAGNETGEQETGNEAGEQTAGNGPDGQEAGTEPGGYPAEETPGNGAVPDSGQEGADGTLSGGAGSGEVLPGEEDAGETPEEELTEETDEKENELKETAAATVLDGESRPLDGEVQAAGTREDPVRFLVSAKEPVTVKREFLEARIREAAEREEYWISLEAHADDDPAGAVLKRETDQKECRLLADMAKTASAAWFAESGSPEWLLDLAAVPAVLKTADGTVVLESADEEEPLKGPVLLRGAAAPDAAEGTGEETPENGEEEPQEEPAPVPVESVRLDKRSLTLDAVGKTATLKATVEPEDAADKTVLWSSSDTAVVTVSKVGKVTAKKAGRATITAVSKDNEKAAASCVVTVSGFAEETENGNTVTRYYDNGKMQKGWQTITDTIAPVQSAAAAEGHTYEILCAKDAGFALDVYGGSVNPRANVDIYRRNGTAAQTYTLYQQADGSWQIRNGGGMVLDVSGGSTSAKANIQTYTWNGTDAQKFTIRKNDDGTVSFVNKKSGLVLDVSGGKMLNKQNVQQYPSNGTAAQKWILSDVTKYYFDNAGIMKTGWQTISGKKYYFLSNGVMATGFQKIGGKWYYFSAGGVMQTGWKTIGGKKYYFGADGAAETGWYNVSEKEAGTGTGKKYSSAPAVSGHTYVVLSAKDQNFALDVAGGSYKARANIDIYKRNGTEAQSYVFTKQSDGSWKIQNFKGMVLDVAGASKADKANVQTYGWNGTNAQKFTLQENPDGSVTFLNKSSGKALDISGGKMLNKQNVQQYRPNGTAAQKWVLVDVTKYYINTKGSVLTGWQTISGKKYYFLSNGIMATGWRTISGKRYYFQSDGVMVTGYQTIGGRKYCFSSDDGSLVKRTADSVLNVMRSWIGYSEANGKYKEIIDLYNSVEPLPVAYVVKYTDEWCDTTVTAAAIKAGASDLIGRECGVQRNIDIFKNMGIWIEDGTITPKPGYVICFSSNADEQPNDAFATHIGYVESVANGIITTIEGNTWEAVARRYYEIGEAYIRGYAAPAYE